MLFDPTKLGGSVDEVQRYLEERYRTQLHRSEPAIMSQMMVI